MSEERDLLQTKYGNYARGSYFFVLIMLGLSLLNVPLILFGVTRFYFSYIFVDMILSLKFEGAFVIAILAIAALAAVTIFVRKKYDIIYIGVLGTVTLADLVTLMIKENHLNYILSIFAHMWVIYTFIALTVLKYKLRRIS